MGIREVGYRELALVKIAGVAVLREALVPVPDLVAQIGFDAQFVIEAELDNAVDIAQAFLQFKVGMVFKAPGKGADDLLLIQSGAARAAHCKDERKTEFVVVGLVQLLDGGELLRRALCQAGLALLIGGFLGQAVADHRLAGKFGVCLDQANLRIAPGVFQHAGHHVFEVRR